MHDLIRDMGREIVREKSPNNLGKRCRLWSHEEAFNVLKKRKGTQNVEGLLLNFGSEAKDGSLKVEAFKEMSGLRLLQIDHAYLEGDFDHFPGELKWLRWKGLPSKCTISHQEKLSVLDLSRGMITDDWSGWQHIQLIKTLKVLDLRDCWYLTRTPDFSSLTNLERLILDGCLRLVVCHESIGQLKNLDLLSLEGCVKLVELPDSISNFSCLSRLQTLNLSWCAELQSIPELPSSLIKLHAEKCFSMERLQLSNLKFLQELDLSHCRKLSEIQGISGLPLLQKLCLSGCKTLQSLPELPSSLVRLDISECISMERLPNLSNLKILEHICLDNCKKLVEIQGMKGLILLQKLYLVECGELQSLPEMPLGNLRELVIRTCRNLAKIQGISCLPRLQILSLQYCVKLQSLSMLPSSLVRLQAYGCRMERLPDMSNLKNLEVLVLGYCYNLCEIQGIGCLPLLQRLELKNCDKLQSLPKLPLSLIRLKANACSSLQRLPDMSNLKNLEVLELRHCDNLAEIRGLEGLESLTSLRLFKCDTCIQNLPKTIAQGILPSASDKLNDQKQYLIPDGDSINGVVFFLVFQLSGRLSDCSSYNFFIDISADIERKNGARISSCLHLRLQGWKNTVIVDQFYACYFQGLSWFGMPLQKGDILKLSADPSNSPFGCDLDVKMLEFFVADEAVEDDQQLEKGVKQLITSILECEPKNHKRAHSPYRMRKCQGEEENVEIFVKFRLKTAS